MMFDKLLTFALLLFTLTIIKAESEQKNQVIRDQFDGIHKYGKYGNSNFLENPENKLSYFREDYILNLIHWHWHMVHPYDGDEDLVRRDRRGETFYYFHQQILARYDIERLCNGLNVTKLWDWEQIIEEDYSPSILNNIAIREWASRPRNAKLKDINRPDFGVETKLDTMRQYRDRVYEAIDNNRVKTANNSYIEINNDQGVHILGVLLEAAEILSPDLSYYGQIHNFGHGILAFAHDPDGQYKDEPGVMGRVATSMRDPVFFRWHYFINSIFVRHKKNLPSYTEKDLRFDGIQVASINVTTLGYSDNVLVTSMATDTYDASKGLDFMIRNPKRGPVMISQRHLTNKDFVYNIRVNNYSGRTVNGTVRIFMGPAHGYRNRHLTLQEQKNFMIEMDKFIVTLPPVGDILITRRSIDSSLTIPQQQAIYSLKHTNVYVEKNITTPSHILNAREHNYDCGCGLPEHLLVPKGTPEGYPMTLFVMISDYEQDRVDDPKPKKRSTMTGQYCKTSLSFCGATGRLFPDRRPMGYPFDRNIDENITTLEEYTNHYSNMGIVPVQIKHVGEESPIVITF